MAVYLHPGVYMEEIPSGVKPIEAVETSTAAFIGYTRKGPVGIPNEKIDLTKPAPPFTSLTLIKKWDEYLDIFDGYWDRSDEKTSNGDPKIDQMGFSVYHFFLNGGSKAYIVRLATQDNEDLQKNAKKAEGLMHYAFANPNLAIKFTAINEGSWANHLIIKLDQNTLDNYTLSIGKKNEKGGFKEPPLEKFIVNLDPLNPLYLEKALNRGNSKYITAQVEGTVPPYDLSMIPADYFLGTYQSGPIVGNSLDFSALTGAELGLTISIDGVDIKITIPNNSYKNKLTELAAKIQESVRKTNAPNSPEAQALFTCEVKVNDKNEKKLCLISGSRTNDSSVIVKSASKVTGLLNLEDTPTSGREKFNGLKSAENTLAIHNWAELVGGNDGSDNFSSSEYKKVFTEFEKYRDIRIICLPGQSWPSDGTNNSIIEEAVTHAEKVKNCMVIVDPPPEKKIENEQVFNDINLPNSTYTALYYPWVKINNPYYDEKNPGKEKTLLIQPSGFVAGMWAKIDGTRGVWKAPAGVETNLFGASGFYFVVEDADQDILNPLGVNCLRTIPGYGRVIWGTRTSGTKKDPEWRYIPVRRTAMMIEQSIYNGIQWAVFEPNNHPLWASLRTNIDAFMNGLYRSGAFQGETASQAYFVRCNLGDTMTQADIDRGQVIVIVGFAPLKPAEFVIVRIQQKVGQQ